MSRDFAPHEPRPVVLDLGTLATAIGAVLAIAFLCGALSYAESLPPPSLVQDAELLDQPYEPAQCLPWRDL